MASTVSVGKWGSIVAVMQLVFWLVPIQGSAQQAPATLNSSESQPAYAAARPVSSVEVARPFRLEFRSFDNIVSNQFGQWWGGGMHLSYEPSRRWMADGELLWQNRPGESEYLYGFRTLLHWSEWLSTDLAFSGGGPDDPAAFFPRFRYDVTANIKVPGLPGLILTGGLTRLYFGNPNNGRVGRVGAVYYWRRFVFQGTLNLNNARPGNLKSKSVNGAVQYGQEGRYWMGLIAGGGREAWQMLTFIPQDVEFTSYTNSVFLRKWLAPSHGVVFSYTYSVKRAAYRIHGLEMKFFLDF